MAKILWREAALILAAGILCVFSTPLLVSMDFTPSLFWVGLLLGLSFAPMYALSALAGSKMPAKIRNWLGIAAGVALLVEILVPVSSVRPVGVQHAPGALYTLLAPVAYGVLLAALAAWHGHGGARWQEAQAALFAYAFPLLIVRWLLVPMVGGSPQLSAVALQTGVAYMFLHGLLRIYQPGPAEGRSDKPLLVRPPVPYAVVALVERIARHRALPYATDANGERDRRAISVLCTAAESGDLVAKLQAALADMDFAVAAGVSADGKTEVSIRPRA